jgi:hypothetical protein
MSQPEQSLVRPEQGDREPARKLARLVRSDRNTPGMAHPTKGLSMAAKDRADSRDSALRAIILAIGPEKILGLIARHDSYARALQVAGHLRVPAQGFIDATEAAQRRVTQSAVIVGGWSPDHDERVLTAIHQGRSIAEIQAVRQEVRSEAAAAAVQRAEQEAARLGPAFPLREQVSVVSADWADDPRHDPRVVAAMLRNAPLGEIGRLIQQVTDERRASKPPASQMPQPAAMPSARPAPPRSE